MPGPLDAFDRIDVNPPPLADPGPPAPDGFFANFGRAFSGERLVARSDRFDAEDLRLHREYGPILDALGLPGSDNPAGFSDQIFRGGYELHASSLKKGEGWPGNMATRAEQEALIAGAIGARQARDPNFLKGVPANVEGLHQWMLKREAERRSGAAGQVEGTRGVGGFLGHLAGGAVETSLDTPNLITLPLGGVGRTVATRMLTEGLVMAGVTAAEQPQVAENRAKLGADYSASDFAFNVGSAFVGGALFRGAGEAVAHGMGVGMRSAFPDFMRQRDADAFGKAMNRAVDMGRFDEADLPSVAARLMDPQFAAMGDEEAAAQVARELAAGTIDDRGIAAAFAGAVPEDRRTPDEKGALAQVGRDADTAETSPFEPGPAGDQAHDGEFAAAIARVTDPSLADVVGGLRDDAPGSAQPLHQPSAGPPPRTGEDAIRGFKAKARAAESGGAGDGATNAASSASGRYQFTMSTWLNYYRRRYGKGEAAAAIWKKRFDPALQEVLMDDLTRDNARLLRGAGLPVTERNLYLVHFLGPKAEHVLHADPHAPVSELLPPEFIAANRRVLEGKSAGEVIAWADRKMGGAGDGRSEPGSGIAEGDYAAGEGEAPARPVFPGTGNEESRAFKPVDDADLVEPVTVADHEPRADFGDDLDRPSLRASLFGSAEEHAAAQVELWREKDRAAGIVDPIIPQVAEPTGKAITVPEKAPRKRYGPVDVLQAVADAGGLADNEGHDLVAGRGIPKFKLGAGTIVRREGGRSVDAMGEHLWEKGYFGPPSVTPRPDESAVLDLIERAAHERVFIPGEEGPAPARGLSQEEEDARFELAEHAREDGIELDPATLDAALDHRAQGAPVGEAVARAIAEAPYRDAAEPAGLERFDDPEMAAAAEQADSLEHDLRMEIGRVAEDRPAPRRRSGLTGDAAEPLAAFNNVKHVETRLRKHPDYAAAKGGDAAAAARLVRDITPPEFLQEVRARFPGAIFVPVAAIEESGANKLPQAFAALLAHVAEGEVDRGLIQANRAFHTNAGAIERLISPPVFDGPVRPGGRYVIVDDVTTLGSTLAELANHIQEGGGEVAGSALLVNASRVGVLTPDPVHLELLERKFGDVVRQEFGVEPSALTRPEVDKILAFRDADSLRARIAKARVERGDRLGARGVQEEPAGAVAPPETYRLDEDAGDVDAGAVLDEIEQEEQAAEALRACMAPPKAEGGE
jgi:hypothetical protein